MAQFNQDIIPFKLILVVLCIVIGSPVFADKKTQPNIVLINLDDADYRMFTPELLSFYPSIESLAKEGISFTNLHVTTPFCGPSRASLFRGQYAHRTGVRVNVPESPLSLGFKGGYREFLRQGHHRDELGVWMKQAGYRTTMIGKYHHNGFDFKVPPGWDDFYMSNGSRYMGTYRFTNRHKPNGDHSRNGVEVYRTDQEAADAVRIIQGHAQEQDPRPLFLYVAPLGPHRPGGPDFSLMVDKKKYGQWHPELKIPATPDFDTAHSDRPFHRQSPPYSERELETLNAEYLCRARSLKSVDDLLCRIVDALKQASLYENTFLLFTSDNGYQLGQHRLHNKLDPYELCTRVPLFVVGPGIKPATGNHLLKHIDLCPTILELGKAKVPEFVDGKSFVPLLRNPSDHQERDWQRFVLLENWQAKRNRGKTIPGVYQALRYYDELYIQWGTGDREYYQLALDPFQLTNRYKHLSQSEQAALAIELANARNNRIDPLVTIIPAPIIESEKAQNRIYGFAEDDGAVSEVRLTIKDHASGDFWNGVAWSDRMNDVAATLPKNPAKNEKNVVKQGMIHWHYSFDKLTAERTIDVVARAYDAEGNQSQAFTQQVRVYPKTE